MKAYKKLLVMFLMGASVLNYSCSKDDTTANPTLTVQQNKTEGVAGDVIEFTVNASADPNASLKTLKIEEVVTGQTVGGTLKDSTVSGKNIVNYVYKYTIPQGATGAKDIKFTVTDNGSRTKTVTKSVTVSGTATPKTYTARILGAQTNGSAGSFFATETGDIYTVSQAKANQGKVDFIYYFGSTNKASIAAPNDAGAAQFNVYDLGSWTTKNATMFKKAASSAFDANTSAALGDAYTNASGSEMSSATSLATGDVVAFKTAAGKNGVFKVVSIVAGDNGSITVDVKVQP